LLARLPVLERNRALPTTKAIRLPIDFLDHRRVPRHEGVAFWIFNHLAVIH
jgi:hypothetical protein